MVLFDWPRDPSEFLRRVGRTARAGSGGRATALVVGKRQVATARAVAEAARHGKRLSDAISTNDKDKKKKTKGGGSGGGGGGGGGGRKRK